MSLRIAAIMLHASSKQGLCRYLQAFGSESCKSWEDKIPHCKSLGARRKGQPLVAKALIACDSCCRNTAKGSGF